MNCDARSPGARPPRRAALQRAAKSRFSRQTPLLCPACQDLTSSSAPARPDCRSPNRSVTRNTTARSSCWAPRPTHPTTDRRSRSIGCSSAAAPASLAIRGARGAPAPAHRSAGEHDRDRASTGRSRWCIAPTASSISYGGLALATGARLRRLAVPGAGLRGVHTLRTIDDAAAHCWPRSIAARRSGAPVIVIGGGFIGLEMAATARKLGLEVTVLEGLGRLMSRVVAPIVSEAAAHAASRPRRAAGVRCAGRGTAR